MQGKTSLSPVGRSVGGSLLRHSPPERKTASRAPTASGSSSGWGSGSLLRESASHNRGDLAVVHRHLRSGRWRRGPSTYGLGLSREVLISVMRCRISEESAFAKNSCDGQARPRLDPPQGGMSSDNYKYPWRQLEIPNHAMRRRTPQLSTGICSAVEVLRVSHLEKVVCETCDVRINGILEGKSACLRLRSCR